MNESRLDRLVASSKQHQHGNRIKCIETQHVMDEARIFRWLRPPNYNRQHRYERKDDSPIRDRGLSRRVIHLRDYWLSIFRHYSNCATAFRVKNVVVVSGW